MTRPRLELAEVIRRHGSEFLDQYGATLSAGQRRALEDIAPCRTAALGGHVEACDQCGHRRIAYNSCRNRHCPKCQAQAGADWMAARAEDPLAGGVLPRRLHAPARPGADRAAEPGGRLRPAVPGGGGDLARGGGRSQAPRGTRSASMAVLHTWGQTLHYHPHVHCVVPGGGLSPDGSRWIACRPGFFLPVRVLSAVFRGKFLALLEQAFARDRCPSRATQARGPRPTPFDVGWWPVRKRCGSSTPSRHSVARSRC